MNVRGILPTERPDDIPFDEWTKLYIGQAEVLHRALTRFWIVLLHRPLRRARRRLSRLRTR